MSGNCWSCKGPACDHYAVEAARCSLLALGGLAALLHCQKECGQEILNQFKRFAATLLGKYGRHSGKTAEDVVHDLVQDLMRHGVWFDEPSAFIFGYAHRVLYSSTLRTSLGVRKEPRRCSTCVYSATAKRFGIIETSCMHPDKPKERLNVGYRLPLLDSCIPRVDRKRTDRHACEAVVYESSNGDIRGVCSRGDCAHRRAGATLVHWDPAQETVGCKFHSFHGEPREILGLSLDELDHGVSDEVADIVATMGAFVRTQCSDCTSVEDVQRKLQFELDARGIWADPDAVLVVAKRLYRCLELIRKKSKWSVGDNQSPEVIEFCKPMGGKCE